MMFELLENILTSRNAQVPEAWNDVLDSEGIIYWAEKVPTTITYRDYSRPGKQCRWNRKSGFSTAIVVTEKRFIVFRNGQKVLNLPFDSEHWNAVSLTLRSEFTLRVVANVDHFPNADQGEVEFWWDTTFAPGLFHTLCQLLGVHP